MIESRRAARATGPSRCSPPLSGPRWASIRLIAARRSGSGRPARDAIPQIPHTRPTLRTRPAAQCTGVDRARRGGERPRRWLRARAAPDEARLPARQPALVDELEVEEGAHVRLACREQDRPSEVSRLERRRDRRDVLAPAVARAEARRDPRLEAVLEVPDVER